MRSVHEERLFGVVDEDIRSFSTVGLKKCCFCMDSGKLYSDACALDLRGSRLDVGYFEAGFMPKMHCDRHIPVLYDTEMKALASEHSNPENLICASLLKAEERSFPKDIPIGDDEYMIRVEEDELDFRSYYSQKRRRLS
jgi:penicillin-binding protein 1A